MVDGSTSHLVEINCETDFVAKSESFIDSMNQILGHMRTFNPDNAEALLSQEEVQGLINFTVTQTGEKIVLAFAESVKHESGFLGSYLHNKVGDNMGQIGVITHVETEAPIGQSIANALAMHIAAMRPSDHSALMSQELVSSDNDDNLSVAKYLEMQADKAGSDIVLSSFSARRIEM